MFQARKVGRRLFLGRKTVPVPEEMKTVLLLRHQEMSVTGMTDYQ